MPQPSFISFRDIGHTFSAHPVNGSLNTKTNLEAIKNSVRNIILTNHGERFFDLNFGGNVSAHLFENATSFTEGNIARSMKQAIENYEPRVEIIDIKVDADPDDNEVVASLKFKAINDPNPYDLAVILERVR